jgi:hypothetical protein
LAVPIRYAAVPALARRCAGWVGIEGPLERATAGIERDDSQFRRRRIEHAVDHDRVALDLGAWKFVAGIEAPSDLEAGDIRGCDLRRGRVLNVVRPAVIRRPLLGQQEEGEKRQSQAYFSIPAPYSARPGIETGRRPWNLISPKRAFAIAISPVAAVENVAT